VKYWVSEKTFLSQTTGLNALIFGLKHPWDKKNKVPGVINGPALREHNLI